MEKKKLTLMVEDLNMGYIDIRKGIRQIQEAFFDDPDTDTYLYRINKQLDLLHANILQRLNHEFIDDEFQNITKKLGESL